MQTFEANRAAVGDRAKAVSLALLKRGMRRASVQLVRRQWEPPVPGRRQSWYCGFWRWFEAVFEANRRGAEFLVEDFCARFEALRSESAGFVSPLTWNEHVAHYVRVVGEAAEAAILDSDPALIRVRLAEVVAASRDLLAAIEAREKSRAKVA